MDCEFASVSGKIEKKDDKPEPFHFLVHFTDKISITVIIDDPKLELVLGRLIFIK